MKKQATHPLPHWRHALGLHLRQPLRHAHLLKDHRKITHQLKQFKQAPTQPFPAQFVQGIADVLKVGVVLVERSVVVCWCLLELTSMVVLWC